jgi:hypothetical protein
MVALPCAAVTGRNRQDVRGNTTPLGKGTRCASPLHPPAGKTRASSTKFEARCCGANRAVPIPKGHLCKPCLPCAGLGENRPVKITECALIHSEGRARRAAPPSSDSDSEQWFRATKTLGQEATPDHPAAARPVFLPVQWPEIFPLRKCPRNRRGPSAPAAASKYPRQTARPPRTAFPPRPRSAAAHGRAAAR